MNSVVVTKHAEKRIKERIGGNKKSAHRIAQRAYNDGLTEFDCKGTLNWWMRDQFYAKCTISDLRLYRDHLFLFNKSVLITVLPMPNALKYTYHRMTRPALS